MPGNAHEPIAERAEQAGEAPVAPGEVAAAGRIARAVGNRAFAGAALARRTGPAVVARDPDDEAQPPVSPEVRALAETRIAPELRDVATDLRSDPPPTLEHLRGSRTRVAAARALFDTQRPAGDEAASNWDAAIAETAIARTLLDGLLFPGSDAGLRLSWGKALGTCRQLVGLLRQAAADAPPAPALDPAPSPNPLPPPKPPPIGSEPEPAPASPDVAMESEICPRIEEAIGLIPQMMVAETVTELEAIRDRFSDIPDRIVAVGAGQEFAPVAALEFQKGLELVNQATLAPADQLENIAGTLETAATLATSLGGDPAPAFTPAPSPNPLPPPPPPPLER